MQLTPLQSTQEYTLFAFKLTLGSICSGVAGWLSHSKGGNLRLELSFSQPTPANLKLILTYQPPAVL